MLRALTVLEAKHPRAPHYYLAFVGVDPDWQGRGLGSSVMSPIIERCDADGMAAFSRRPRAATAPSTNAMASW